MKRFLLLSIVIILTQSLFAQIPAGYYDAADGLTGEALKNALHDIIDGHTVKSYSDLWTILKETDEDPNNTDNFILIYTGQSIPKTSVYPAFNREHVWAKSHGFPNESDYGYTDAHHLRPSDVDVNSARGNLDFDNGGTLVSGTSDCYSDGDSWEPRDEVKGDIARMMFYMVVRYEGDGGTNDDYDLELVDYVGTSGTEFGKLSTLLEWHNNDPVDEMDIQRNEVVYSYQNNRNPFIDHPEYVTAIWGGSGNMLPSISDITTSPANPTADDLVSVSATLTDSDGSISKAELHWGTVSGSLTNTISMSFSAADLYITDSDIPAQTNGITVYFEIEVTDNESGVNTSSEQSYTVSEGSAPSNVIFEEDFETLITYDPVTINGWTLYNDAGTESWEGRDYNSNEYAQMSAYGTNEASIITWMITPEIDLTNVVTSTFNFISKDGYNNGDPVVVFISTDFLGTGDPGLATWNQLNPTIATGTSSGYAASFTESGNVDLTDYCGNTVYIAYVYTGGDPSLTTTIQIDDVLVTGEENQNPEVTNVSNDPVIPLQNEDVTISATITDDGTITSTKIKWGISSGNYNNTDTLTYTGSNDIFTGVIEAQAAETTVYYLIEAKDDFGGSFRSNEYSYTVAANQMPAITEVDKSPETVTDADDISITATISDIDGTISSATIKWGTSAGGPYSNSITMGNVGDAYSGIITAQSGGTTIHYIIEAIDNDGGSNRSEEESFTVNTTGNNHPVLSDLLFNPSDPESTENVTVTVTITDSDDLITSAKIKWGTDSDAYDNEIIMTNTDDDYSGEIPAQADGTHVYFIVEARDGSGGVTKSTEQDYIVFDPNILPEISGVSFDPSDPESDEDVRVTATITDSDGTISVAQVKWGTSPGVYPNTVTMSGTNGEYLGTIPAQADGAHIYCIVYTEDNEGATAQSDEYDYVVDDLILPEISGISINPTSPTEEDVVAISATITDSDGTISNAELHWGVSAESLTNTISMSVSSGDTYITNSDIPVQASGTIVYFEIEATDNDALVASQTGNYTVSSSSGIVTLTDSQLKIYPNPTSDKLYIIVEEEEYLKKVIVYNLIGEKILEMNDLNSINCTIHLNDYPKGIYIIQVQGENNLNVKKVMHK